MTRKSNFMVKTNLLISAIRERGKINLGEACAILSVGPWQIKHYAEAILDLCGDIRWDGKSFQTVIETNPDLRQKKLV